MTVWAKQLQVLKSIIKPVTVYVMQLNRYRLTQPPASSASFAAMFFQFISQQPQLEFMAANETPPFSNTHEHSYDGVTLYTPSLPYYLGNSGRTFSNSCQASEAYTVAHDT